MAVTVPESHRDLLEEPVHVTLATLMPDGQPQVTVVWADYDGTHVLVNTARNRQKEKNMRQNPKVTVLAVDPNNPYRYLELRGTVIEITENGATEHIDALARKYLNKPAYYGHAAPTEQQARERRVICKILPENVRTIH